eukprot:10379805-Lingulodinium_polyedra.AAC.1
MEGLGRHRAPVAFPPVAPNTINFISVGANSWALAAAEVAAVVREGAMQAEVLLIERDRAR